MIADNIGMETMLRPPINRSMRVLDRSFFQKSIRLAAARINSNQWISGCRTRLRESGDLEFLGHTRIQGIRPDPTAELSGTGRKCVLLKERIKVDDTSTWSDAMKSLVGEEKITVIPYDLTLGYDNWDYQEVITSILPPDMAEIPSSFAIVGHVAHLNLRDEATPYKSLVAAVILDKNPIIRTVINKIADVGAESVFRTFNYEVLAGPDDLNVSVYESDCTFKFDYSKVYWNARLQGEHLHMIDSFQEGNVVCDVMAGVGPFAVPAGKRKVFCYANDLNPHSYESLQDAIKRNKVTDYVKGFNEDGHTFIRRAAAELWRTKHTIIRKGLIDKRTKEVSPSITITQPRTFNHYVMNLPASAIDFVPDFVGLYSSIEATDKFPAPDPNSTPLPTVHVYCFSLKSDDNTMATQDICDRISANLGFDMVPGDGVTEGQILVRDVRDVAPKKRMFCATFKLPKAVAWRRYDEAR